MFCCTSQTFFHWLKDTKEKYLFAHPKEEKHVIHADRISFATTALWVNKVQARRVLDERDQDDPDIKENIRQFFKQVDPDELASHAPELWHDHSAVFSKASRIRMRGVLFIGWFEDFKKNLTHNHAWNSLHKENICFSSTTGYPNHFIRSDGWDVLTEHFGAKTKKRTSGDTPSDPVVLVADAVPEPEQVPEQGSGRETSRTSFDQASKTNVGYDVQSVAAIAGLDKVPEKIVTECLPVFNRGEPTATALKGKINRLINQIKGKTREALQSVHSKELITAKLLIATAIYLEPFLEQQYRVQNTAATVHRLCSVLQEKGMLVENAPILMEAKRLLPPLKELRKLQKSSPTTKRGHSSTTPASSGTQAELENSDGEEEEGEEEDEEEGEENDEENTPLRRVRRKLMRTVEDHVIDKLKKLLDDRDTFSQVAEGMTRVANILDDALIGFKRTEDKVDENKTLIAGVRAIMDKQDEQNIAGALKAILDKLDQNPAGPSRNMEDKQKQEEDALIRKEHQVLTQALLMDFVKDRASLQKFWFLMRAAGIPEDRLHALLKNCYMLPDEDYEAVTKKPRP